MRCPQSRERCIILFLVTREHRGGRGEKDYKEQNDEKANLGTFKMLERKEGSSLMEISLCVDVPTVEGFIFVKTGILQNKMSFFTLLLPCSPSLFPVSSNYVFSNFAIWALTHVALYLVLPPTERTGESGGNSVALCRTSLAEVGDVLGVTAISIRWD